VPANPTAQTVRGDTAVMPRSWLSEELIAGARTTFQTDPFQCRITLFWSFPDWLAWVPTTQTSRSDVPPTAFSDAVAALDAGLGTMLQTLQETPAGAACVLGVLVPAAMIMTVTATARTGLWCVRREELSAVS
jgi:hypothetical protein